MHPQRPYCIRQQRHALSKYVNITLAIAAASRSTSGQHDRWRVAQSSLRADRAQRGGNMAAMASAAGCRPGEPPGLGGAKGTVPELHIIFF